MTPQPNHYAIYTGGFKPVVVRVLGSGPTWFLVREGDTRELRALADELAAWGPDKAIIEAAVAKMMKVRAQGDRMRAKARNWVKDENERIVREVMNHE